jgi:hypothetical protein
LQDLVQLRQKPLTLLLSLLHGLHARLVRLLRLQPCLIGLSRESLLLLL